MYTNIIFTEIVSDSCRKKINYYYYYYYYYYVYLILSVSNSNLPIGFNHTDCQTLKLIDFDGNLLFAGGKEVFFFSFAER